MSKRVGFLPFVAFFASGASSLIFQALWTRMLHHVFGATSVAMSSVLTAFMAGLGLGAYWVGKRAHRVKKPLVAYALCELGVAASALLLPWLVGAEGPMAAINAQLRESLHADSYEFIAARFLCVFPLLIVPTTLMGGTLPLLAQHFVGGAHGEQASSRIGALYAVNTFGAVFGTLIGNFVLMPRFGVHTTHLVAVAINVVLAVAIFALPSAPVSAAAAARIDDAQTAAPSRESFSPVTRKLALWTFGLSGACALAYEVVWSRALAMAIGSSMQSFALILITFLLGIAGGSAILSADLAVRDGGLGGLRSRSFAAFALTAVALAPTYVLTSRAAALWTWITALLAILGVHALGRSQSRADQRLGGSGRSAIDRAAVGVLLVPCIISGFEIVRFASRRGDLASVAFHGFLPYIAASVVCSIALFLMLGILYRERLLRLLGLTQLSIAVCTFVSYVFQDEIPYAFARMVSSLDDLPNHVGTVRFFMFLSAGLCTLPATLGMGAMFPITLKIWGDGQRAGESVASVYSANTLGSICGAWLPGFVLMPLYGMERTLHYGMLLNFALAFTLLTAARARLLALATLLASSAFAFVAFSPDSSLAWNQSHMTLGAFRVSLARSVLDLATWGQPDLLYYRDGLSTTVSVERWGSHLSMKNNGKVDASNGDDMPTQIMVAAYPLLLHPRMGRDLDVAVIGFGSGVTVGAALQFPVRHIDAMELERGVVEAAVDYFSDVNHMGRTKQTFPYLDVPRLSVTSDDGRNFLASTSHRYDVIASEPSNPWITGVSDLFTVEHFRISKRRLKPGGSYCQWVQLYEMSPENIKTIYRTFASQFSYVVVFAAEELSSDTILVGSDSPIELDLDRLTRAMADPKIKSELDRALVYSPYHVLSRVLFASKQEVMHFAGNAPPAVLNTDDNMWIELRAPEDLIGFARYQGYLSTFYGPDWPYGRLQHRVRGLDTDQERSALALSLLAHGRRNRAAEWIKTVQDRSAPEVSAAARSIDSMFDTKHEPLPHFEPAEPGPQLDPRLLTRLRATEAVIADHIAKGRFVEALSAFDRLPSELSTRSGPSFQFLHGYLLYKGAGGDGAVLLRAADALEGLLRRDDGYATTHPELFYFAARALDAASSFDRAVTSMREYVALTTSDATE